MSRHSKWSKIKHQKGVSDVKKGALFSKMVRAVTVAAHGGGDPAANFRLRLAIDAAKAAGVTKDTIDRAIARGSGQDREGAALEESLYEAVGPHGIGILIEVLTDNKNRAASEIKHILAERGGALAGPGSVSWQFARKGVINLPLPSRERAGVRGGLADDIQLALIDAGAEDIRTEDNSITVFCAPESLQKLVSAARGANLTVEYAGLEWLPKESSEVSDNARSAIESLTEELEENEDVSEVYTTLVE